LLVIISLKFDEWLKYLSILLGVSISEQYGLLGAFHLNHFQVFQLSCWSLFPHVFESIDLLGLDLASSLLLLVIGESNQPWQQCFVLNQGHPVVRVINTLFRAELSQAGLSAKQNHIGLSLGWHESQKENIGALARVTLQIGIF
jgi:hypothetical protein